MIKKIIIGLAAITVAALGILYIYGEDMLWASITPDYEFGSRAHPPAPDYTKAESWAAWPQSKGGTYGPAERVPEGVARVPESARRADVFFIHPTTDYTGETWVAAIDKPSTNAITDNGVMAGQAAAFNKCCTIYAPRYRQITIAAYRQEDLSVPKRGLEIAYGDVRRAFHHFLSVRDASRPFILASHSQGTSHVLRLLQDEVLNTSLQKQLVAVYGIGGRVPETLFDGPLSAIAPCEGETDIGCFMGWDAFEEDAKDSAMEPPSIGHWDGAGYTALPRLNSLCINPVTWTRSAEPSSKEAHLGAVPPAADFDLGGEAQPISGGDVPLPGPLAQHIAAHCDVGGNINALRISAPRDKSLSGGLLARQGGVLHLLDYSLVFMDIRDNAAKRVDAFLGVTQP